MPSEPRKPTTCVPVGSAGELIVKMSDMVTLSWGAWLVWSSASVNRPALEVAVVGLASRAVPQWGWRSPSSRASVHGVRGTGRALTRNRHHPARFFWPVRTRGDGAQRAPHLLPAHK